MPIMIFTMLVVLVLAAAIIAVVVMGMEGTGRSGKHPEIAEAMARTARHLNGEGEPPRRPSCLFDEIDEVGDINVRDLPDKLAQPARPPASAASAALGLVCRWSSLNPPAAPGEPARGRPNPPRRARRSGGDRAAAGAGGRGHAERDWAPRPPRGTGSLRVEAESGRGSRVR
jgi:hypothetical protein